MIARLKMSRWWDRRGWRAPLVRVLCYVRRRCACVWRTAHGARPPVYHMVTETGGTQSYGSWRAAFTAARAHVGAGR